MASIFGDISPTVRPGFMQGMADANALSGQSIENKLNKIKADFAPLTAQAEAASKLTYANLMGPQFLAKLFGNNDILANIPDSQKQQAMNMLYNAGTRQGSGLNILNQQKSSGSLSDFLSDKIRSVLGGEQNNQGQTNSLLDQPNLSDSDRQNINKMQPGESYTVQGNQSSNPLIPQNKNSFAENVGSYQGIKAEGEELGKIRAKTINDLDNTFYNSQTKGATLDQLTKIVTSPTFEKIRQLPALGNHELSYYARYGTPEEQQLVGQYYTLTGNIIKDSARDFPGQFRRGEQALLLGMKPSPGDTVDAAKGKIESLSIMNQMMGQRSKIMSQLMNQYHIDQATAADIADKQIDGDSIRNKIHSTLNPKPTDSDIEYMSSKYKISKEEVKKRLQKKGLI